MWKRNALSFFSTFLPSFLPSFSPSHPPLISPLNLSPTPSSLSPSYTISDHLQLEMLLAWASLWTRFRAPCISNCLIRGTLCGPARSPTAWCVSWSCASARNYLQLSVHRRASTSASRVMRKPLPRVLCNKSVKQGASTNTHSAGHPLLPPTVPQYLLSPVSLAQGRGVSF